MDYSDKKYHRKLLTEKYPISKEDRFLELIDDIEIKVDKEKYLGSVFFFKDEKCFFEHNSKYDYLWCDYNNIWSVFEREYGLSHTEIQSFIKYMLEKHFKMKVSTLPSTSLMQRELVEKHFKRHNISSVFLLITQLLKLIFFLNYFKILVTKTFFNLYMTYKHIKLTKWKTRKDKH